MVFRSPLAARPRLVCSDTRFRLLCGTNARSSPIHHRSFEGCARTDPFRRLADPAPFYIERGAKSHSVTNSATVSGTTSVRNIVTIYVSPPKYDTSKTYKNMYVFVCKLLVSSIGAAVAMDASSTIVVEWF